MKCILGILLLTFAVACGQKPDDTFTKPIYFPAGIYIGTDPVLHLTWPTGTGGVADWNTLLNKPLLFPPAIHDHATLYKPIGYLPTWAEITGKPLTFVPSAHVHKWSEIIEKPDTIGLRRAIESLGYLPIPHRTTAEIDATILPINKGGIVLDTVLNVYKVWSKTYWKILPTTN